MREKTFLRPLLAVRSGERWRACRFPGTSCTVIPGCLHRHDVATSPHYVSTRSASLLGTDDYTVYSYSPALLFCVELRFTSQLFGCVQTDIDKPSSKSDYTLKLFERIVVRHAFNATPLVGCTGNGQNRSSIRVTDLTDSHATE